MNKEFTATDIVKDLYNKFPEVSFYDERDLDDDYVGLIFDAKKSDQEILEKYIKRYNCSYKFKGGKLIIKAKEDEEYKESLKENKQSLKEDYDYYDWDALRSMHWSKQLPYSSSRIEMAKKNLDNYGFLPFVKDIVPSEQDIFHIYQAKKKLEDKFGKGSHKLERYSGININSITDPQKFLNYLYAAIILQHFGYVASVERNITGFNHLKFNGVNLQYPVLKALGIYLSTDPNNIKPSVDSAIKAGEEKEAAKEVKRQARAAKSAEKKQAALASAGYTAGTLKSNISNISNIKDALQKLTEFSNDINVTGGSDTVQTTPRGTRYTEYTITYNEGKPYEYKDTITIKQIGDGSTNIISGKEFKNLPEKQFIGWMKRKLDQLKEEENNTSTDSSDDQIEDIPEEYLGESVFDDYEEDEMEFYDPEISADIPIKYEEGHTIDEYMSKYGEMYDEGDLWDFPREELERGAIYPDEDQEFWLIDDRYYEVPSNTLQESYDSLDSSTWGQVVDDLANQLELGEFERDHNNQYYYLDDTISEEEVPDLVRKLDELGFTINDKSNDTELIIQGEILVGDQPFGYEIYMDKEYPEDGASLYVGGFEDETDANYAKKMARGIYPMLFESQKILYVIKDKHGNQCSRPNEDDQELWDRIEGKPGYKVVVYTGEKE